MDNKKAIKKPIIQAAIILGIFLVIEIALVYLDVSPDYNILLCVDIILRIIFGTVSLFLLKNYAKCGESKFPVKNLFTNKISASTWFIMIPVVLFIIAPFFKLFTAYKFVSGNLLTLTIIIIQQFAVGYFEEATHRGLMMNGLLKNNTSTCKQRIITVLIAGAFFGLSHGLNIFFGENPLVQVPSTMLTGMFLASIFMLTDNLLIVMVIHTLNDSTFRIVDGLFGYVSDAPICQAVDITRNVIDYAVLPIVAILICIFYDKLKSETIDE